MPDSKVIGLDGLHKKLDKFTRGVPGLNRAVVNDVALAAKTVLLSAAAQDAPGRKLSRFARGRGATLNVNYRIKQKGRYEASALVLPTPPGPWYLLEKGAQHPYPIRGRGTRRFLGSRERGFATSGAVIHPATRGKGTWSKGARLAVAAGSASFRRSGRDRYLGLLR